MPRKYRYTVPVAKKLKDYYDADAARLLADRLGGAAGETGISFDAGGFVTAVTDSLAAGDPSFGARQDLFAAALEHHLPADYASAVSLLTAALGPPLEQPEGMFTYGWWLWPVGRYVERNALRDPAVSMDFIYELTRRFTGEFAIRPILAHQPERTLDRLAEWARDADVHVRRLAGEGMRIRLPWARRLTVVLDHAPRYRCVLDQLRADPERFVQKSVGNNLNDLMKEDPELAWSIIHDWESREVGPETAWIIRHGTRNVGRGKRTDG